ncbi:MAG: hypothetical protein ABS89_06620 [Thiobacillus sp. SCN 63-1177]|nr:MAG: hypothetical protein ABS89_06620 [Thiobacillus sp. SCN 63-1177]OJW45885.1 MAG: hypothetical protein BGO60_04920 [Thiobacillus sp. 65-1059]
MSTDLHPSIVALISLAANVAANHPGQGLCQLERLKDYGVSREQIDTVIEIARHIRDESAQKLDAKFDAAYAGHFPQAAGRLAAIAVAENGACCTPTPSGKSCC